MRYGHSLIKLPESKYKYSVFPCIYIPMQYIPHEDSLLVWELNRLIYPEQGQQIDEFDKYRINFLRYVVCEFIRLELQSNFSFKPYDLKTGRDSKRKNEAFKVHAELWRTFWHCLYWMRGQYNVEFIDVARLFGLVIGEYTLLLPTVGVGLDNRPTVTEIIHRVQKQNGILTSELLDAMIKTDGGSDNFLKESPGLLILFVYVNGEYTLLHPKVGVDNLLMEFPGVYTRGLLKIFAELANESKIFQDRYKKFVDARKHLITILNKEKWVTTARDGTRNRERRGRPRKQVAPYRTA